MVPFSFAGEELALAEGLALYWPRERALLVADLHLEKASFYARFGQMLPPYDSRETLGRLADAVRATGAHRACRPRAAQADRPRPCHENCRPGRTPDARPSPAPHRPAGPA
ncbi:MAG: hypothetical protein ACKOPM_02745, partial [Novosphingobium sp.]